MTLLPGRDRVIVVVASVMAIPREFEREEEEDEEDEGR